VEQPFLTDLLEELCPPCGRTGVNWIVPLVSLSSSSRSTNHEPHRQITLVLA